MGQYSIKLSQEQRQRVEQLVRTGTASARSIKHAHIVLKADTSSQGPAWSDRQIQEAFEVGYSTVLRVRKQFVQHGLEAALFRKAQPARPDKRKLDGVQEAQVIAVVCQQKPQGRTRWTMRLLAKRLVELDIVESISPETVRQVLKKTR